MTRVVTGRSDSTVPSLAYGMNPTRSVSTPAAIIVIILLGMAGFGRLAKYDFTSWDDYETLARNPDFNPPTSRALKSFWTEPQMHLYVPVTYTVWFLTANGAAGPTGLDPRVFHTLNIALHIASACIAYLLLRSLLVGDAPALIGALLFLLHPVQVEPVAWISGTKDLLFGLLSLLAIWQYIRLARDDAKGALVPPGEWWGRYLIATALFVLAMLSKPTAMIVPLVVLTLDVLVLGRSWRGAIRWTLPWMVLAVPCAVIAVMAQPAPDAHLLAGPIWTRPLIAGDALAFYLRKLVYPVNLVIDYGREPQRAMSAGTPFYAWLAPAAIVAVLFIFRRHTRPLIAAALVFVIVLLPVLGLVPFDFQAYSTVADHYLYLAMLGPALALAWAISRWGGRWGIAIALGILAILGFRTFDQAGNWRDSSALFGHTLEVNPTSLAALNNLAAAAVEREDFPLAIALSEKTIRSRPTYPPGYLTYGNALMGAGRFPQAIVAYRRVLELLPDHPPALSNLAALLAQQGNLTEALPVARRAVEVEPASIPAHLNLGRIYLQLNDPAAARAQFDQVLRMDPNNPVALDLRGRLSPASTTGTP